MSDLEKMSDESRARKSKVPAWLTPFVVETKTYSDGTTATGTAPLPARSPRQQEVNQAAPIWATCPKCSNHERCEERGCADRASTATAPTQDDECPKCGTEEWDRITNRVAPGEVFNRCARCGNEWEAQ